MTNIDHAAEIIERATRGAHTTDGHPMKMSGHTAQIIAESLADAGLLAPEPWIVRTRDELATLDPDTLVAMNPIIKGHATAYVWSADTALRVDLPWHAPLAIIATGDQVRAARQALEATDAVD